MIEGAVIMFSERNIAFHEALNHTLYSTNEKVISENEAFELFSQFLTSVEQSGKVVYTIGNGGSASLASLFSMHLLKCHNIPAQTFHDPSLMTCIGNDLGYPSIFTKPLSLLGKEGDLLVSISGSGKSPNIVDAAKLAKEKGMEVVTLTGFREENPLRALGDLNFFIPSQDNGFVEMGHFFLLHAIIDSLNLRGCLKSHSGD